jgi:hypothetical protein
MVALAWRPRRAVTLACRHSCTARIFDRSALDARRHDGNDADLPRAGFALANTDGDLFRPMAEGHIAS